MNLSYFGDHAPHLADEDLIDEGIEIRWRAVAWRVAVLLVGAAGLALIWIGAATVYGWIAR